MSETWEYVDELEDGAVYFIRNALYDSKVLDVPNGNYSNNTNIILYSNLGWGNQRFVLNRECIIDGKQTYSLSPVEDETKFLSIQDKSDDENKALQIQTKTNYSGSYKAVLDLSRNQVDSQKISLPSNAEITLENSFVLNINQKQRNIKRVQYITHYKNYDALEEKYYDVDTGEEILEEIILKSFL